MSREFVDSIEDGNNLGAQKAFKDSIAGKVGDALEIKRKEVSKTFVEIELLKAVSASILFPDTTESTNSLLIISFLS